MKFNANLTLILEARFLNAQNIVIIVMCGEQHNGSTEQPKEQCFINKTLPPAQWQKQFAILTRAHRIRYNMPQCHQTPCAREIQFKTLSKTHNSWKFIIIAIITT